MTGETTSNGNGHYLPRHISTYFVVCLEPEERKTHGKEISDLVKRFGEDRREDVMHEYLQVIYRARDSPVRSNLHLVASGRVINTLKSSNGVQQNT